MTLNEELDAAVATLAPPEESPPRFDQVRRRHRRRRTELLVVATLFVCVVGVSVAVLSRNDSPSVTSSPADSNPAVPTTVPLPASSDALGLTAQLPDGWTMQQGGCPAPMKVTVVDEVTALPTPAGCPDVDRPWMVVQRLPADLDGIDTACTTVTFDDVPVCQAFEIDPQHPERPTTDRRFYAGLDVLVSVGRDASGAPAPELRYADPSTMEAVTAGNYQTPQPLDAARVFVAGALASGCDSSGSNASSAAVDHCRALGLPAGGVVREVGSGSAGGGPATYWIVKVDAPDGTHTYRVLVQSRWDVTKRWVTLTVTDIANHRGSANDALQCPPVGDPRYPVFAGADCPGGAPGAIPDRVGLRGTGSELLGWIDRDAIQPGSDHNAYPNDPDAALSAWTHRLVPVTLTKNRDSKIVGYYVPNLGFLDKAVVDDPAFDLDAIIAQGQCNAGRRILLVNGHPTCT